MATIVNRYKQLLASVPKGSFYASSGQILPNRNTPYEIRLSPGVASRQYGLFVNADYRGIVTTDLAGVAIINVILYRGANTIKLVDSVTQKTTSAYVTTRDYATIMAAQAESIEGIDEDIEQILTDSRLETASVGLIEQVFGKSVQTGNSFGYDLDTYRELLQELRLAYRSFGGTTDGIERVVRAFTKINPLVLDKSFGDAWVLGKDILSPKHSSTTFTYYTSSNLANVNAGAAGISITNFNNQVGVGAGSLKCYGTISPKTLSWTAPNGTEGTQVEITGNGIYRLYSGDSFDPIIGDRGPFDTTGTARILRISADGKTPIDITFGSSGTMSVATAVTTINSALNASIIYGASYSTVADAYDPFASADPFIRLTPPGIGGNKQLKIYTHPTQDIAQILFSHPIVRGGTNAAYLVGATSIVLNGSSDIGLWPGLVTVDQPLKVVIGDAAFTYNGLDVGTANSGNIEEVVVTDVNKTSSTLTLASGLVYNHSIGELVHITGETPLVRYLVQNSRWIDVNVQDYSLLPSSNTTDAVSVQGTGAPDGWVVSTNAGAATTAIASPRHLYFDTDRDVPFDIPANGMITIPIPDEILQYKGFSADFSVWAGVDDPDRAAPQSTITTIGISFDNLATFNTSAPSQWGTYHNATWRQYEFTREDIIIPPSATKTWLRIKTNALGVGNLRIHKIRINVDGHEGLSLGDGTIPRNEVGAKSGLNIYVWDKDQITTYEGESLGLVDITQSTLGHIDKVAPDFAWISKFNVSEYDGSFLPKNIFGYFDEADWIVGTSTNLDLILRTPARFTYLQPSIVSDTTQTIAFVGNLGTLTIASNQESSTSILLEDGIPVPQNLWQYNNSTQIQLLYSPVSTSTYVLSYSALIFYETAGIDLSTAWQDYVWYADYDIYGRIDTEVVSRSISAGVNFDTFGSATLTDQSDTNKSTSTLVEDTGLSSRIIPSLQWSYLSNSRIQISPDLFNPGAIYELTYMGTFGQKVVVPGIQVQIRSATSIGGLSSATYANVVPNTVIDNTYRYHQYRVYITNVTDVRDIRIQSLLLKGLNAFGVGGAIPGMID